MIRPSDEDGWTSKNQQGDRIVRAIATLNSFDSFDFGFFKVTTTADYDVCRGISEKATRVKSIRHSIALRSFVFIVARIDVTFE